jgi:hypothetical protein
MNMTYGKVLVPQHVQLIHVSNNDATTPDHLELRERIKVTPGIFAMVLS